MSKIKKELAEELAKEKGKNDRLSQVCYAYSKELDLLMEFIKSSEMRYQEWTRFQMDAFKKEHEVGA